ncbi:MAG: hypothetical protein A2583_08760 [Bdellovibrionales bacterium RIFOXYD1_FULL_53_11]|nr:MAG: hypothetical protein A2583_08760 [Bdellovibrionales bacterium RIFOXYD1_FULL_53_11]
MRAATASVFMALVALSMLSVGCSSKALKKVGGDNAMPSELPDDIKEKFTVKDISELKTGQPGISAGWQLPAPQASAQPISGVAAKKKSKKKANRKDAKGPATVQTPAAAFQTPEAAPANLQARPEHKGYPSRRPAKDPIWVGEKLTYDVSYFGVVAGIFDLEVLPFKVINNRKVYHVRGEARSSKIFSLFYRMSDWVESFIDYEGFFSHRLHLVLDETKQMRDSLELNDSDKGKTFYWNRWNRHDRGYTEVKEYVDAPKFAQDTLSLVFYVRTVPLPDGAVITVPVISESKNWEAVITVVRREEMSTPLGKIRTVVLKPEMKYQGVLKKQGDSFVWLSDDDRRFLVKLDAKVRIGSILATLKKVRHGAPSQ